MPIYTIHPPPPESGAARRDEVALASESFSWGAFFFGPLWLIAHRTWIGLLAWALVAGLYAGIVAALAGRVSDASLAAGAILAQALFGFEAQEMRRRSLARRGRPIVDVVAARDWASAGALFFRRRERPESERAIAPQPPSRPPAGGFLSMFPGERSS